MKQIRILMDEERQSTYERIANPLIHILATNVGRSLFGDRDQHTVILLDNSTSVPFVTADQPVINIASGPKETTPPAKFELYYPISPTRAMLLLEPSSDFLPSSTSVSEMAVRDYNLRMAAHSHRQVYSTSKESLESIRNELPAYMSCFPD